MGTLGFASLCSISSQAEGIQQGERIPHNRGALLTSCPHGGGNSRITACYVSAVSHSGGQTHLEMEPRCHQLAFIAPAAAGGPGALGTVHSAGQGNTPSPGCWPGFPKAPGGAQASRSRALALVCLLCLLPPVPTAAPWWSHPTPWLGNGTRTRKAMGPASQPPELPAGWVGAASGSPWVLATSGHIPHHGILSTVSTPLG